MLPLFIKYEKIPINTGYLPFRWRRRKKSVKTVLKEKKVGKEVELFLKSLQLQTKTLFLIFF